MGKRSGDAAWPAAVGFVGGFLGLALGIWASYEAFNGGTLPLIGYDVPYESLVLGIVMALVVTPVLFKIGFIVLLLPSLLIEKLTRRR
ncbi:hypothetical protein ACLB9X_30690 [Streptomyces sp. 5K101]|uniref:hypothetical protein n=1 Tax=Streptomyces sp. 5K101 TaxID=3390037 RepID=UPI003976E71F